MSLLKSIARKLPAQPFVITMSIVAGSIHTTITQADDPVPSNDFLALKGLPELVVQYLQAQTEIETGIYHLPFPSAKRLIRELRISELAGTVTVKAPGVEALKPVPVPDDFHVHWYFDSKRHVLMRRLVNADGYVGGGCFYQGTRIWRLEDKFSPQMLTWLGKAEIKGDQLALFMEQGLNAYPCKYFECDLVVEQGFNVLLKIVQLLELSMDVKLVTNLPDLQLGLQAINGSPNDLFSGYMLLPGWGRLLYGQMLTLARSQKAMWLAGDALADFVYNHGAHFAELGLSEAEIARVHTTYTIHDGATLPLAWKITHHTVEGIGHYWATPSLSSKDMFFPIDEVSAKLEAGAQAYSIGSHWVAFTPAFRARHATWKTKKLRPISLLPQEVLGTQLDRLKQLKLVPPSINVNTDASDEQDQALDFFNALRRQGLPAGIYGLQNEIGDILAHVCSYLLQDNPQARILWIMPRRRLEAAAVALGCLDIPVAQTSDDLEGYITLLSPDVIPSINVNWTLIIFSNLDLIASGDAQNRLYASLARKWAIGTFFHPTWAEDRVQAGNLLRVLRLGPDDLAAFQHSCLRTFSTQSDEINPRLASPFKKLTIGEESTGNTAVPIPKPQQPSSPEVREVFRPSFAQTWASESADTSFLASAQRYARQTEPPTEFFPFKQYFPTYRAMTSGQGRWYFYWRDEVRKGNYLDTDLSYLFLHVYEAIHLVGFENALAAFDHLTALWQHYRVAYPQFDNYLVDWLADFLIVYNIPFTPLEWYARAFEAGYVEMEINIALEAWLTTTTGKNIAAIPEPLLDKLCDYDYRKSKFFKQNHTTEYSLESRYREALHLIDTYLHEHTGKSLLEYFRPDNFLAIRHQPFMGAVYEGLRDEIIVASVPDWTQVKELRDSVTSIIKYTENRLRRQQKFKGTIHDNTIFTEWAAVLDEAFPVSSAAPKTTSRKRKASPAREETFPHDERSSQDAPDLTIDFQQVDDLLASALFIQDLLSVEAEDAETVVDTDKEDIVPEPIIAFDLARPSDTPPHLLTDLQEVAQVLSGDLHAVALLRFLQERNWQASEKAAQQILPDEFLSEILYRVNLRALDALGDKLIFIEADQITVTEDYQDEVEHLLSHILDLAYSGQNDRQSTSELPVALIRDIDQLTPEWAAFVQRLQPQHWEMLNVLLSEQNVTLRLESIARGADSMVSLLINEINTIALSSIGDIVIDSTVEPPIIEEEDIDDLHVLNMWVLEHRIEES